MPRADTPSSDSAIGQAAVEPRLVLDTNIVLDLWHFHDPATDALAAAIDARAVVTLVCAATLAELDDVLGRSPFAPSAATIRARYLACAERIIDVRPAPWRCRDVDDQPFIDLALHAGAAFLLTRDQALLALARRVRPAGLVIGPVTVLTARSAQA